MAEIDPRMVKWDSDPAIDPRMVKWDSEPSAVERAKRVAGLGARAAIKGVAAVPTLLAEAVAYPLRKATGAFPSPSGALDSLLTQAGLPAPETPVERVSSDVVSGMTGVGSQIAALRTMANPVAQQLTQAPGRQIAAGATGPGAAGVVREAGGGPLEQAAAGVVGGMAPFASPIATGVKPLTTAEETLRRSREAGYVVPPSQAGGGTIAKSVEGIASAPSVAQRASLRNQEVTNRLTAQDLGLKPGTEITESVLENLRKQAGMTYGRIKMLPLKFKADQEYLSDVANLNSKYAAAAREFPEIAGNKLIDDLQQSLSKPIISPAAAVDLVRKLRFDAAKNAQSIDDPAKDALASAQKAAANAIESLIERRLTQSNQQDLVRQFRDARTLIAKTYDAEAALNPATSNINASALAKQNPISGGMKTASDFAKAFPKASQPSERIQQTPVTPFDLYASMAGLGGGGTAAGVTGNPAYLALAALPLVRPAARSFLTGPYQSMLTPKAQELARNQSIALGLLSNIYAPRE